MNERIKELARQDAANRKHIADLTDTPIKKLAVSSGIYDCITDPYDALNNGDQYSSVMPDLVRFAELIVLECAALFDPGLTVQHEEYIVHESILNHFGIDQWTQ